MAEFITQAEINDAYVPIKTITGALKITLAAKEDELEETENGASEAAALYLLEELEKLNLALYNRIHQDVFAREKAEVPEANKKAKAKGGSDADKA